MISPFCFFLHRQYHASLWKRTFLSILSFDYCPCLFSIFHLYTIFSVSKCKILAVFLFQCTEKSLLMIILELESPYGFLWPPESWMSQRIVWHKELPWSWLSGRTNPSLASELPQTCHAVSAMSASHLPDTGIISDL